MSIPKKPVYLLVNKSTGQIHTVETTVVAAYQAVDRYPKGTIVIYAVLVEVLEESTLLGEILGQLPDKE